MDIDDIKIINEKLYYMMRQLEQMIPKFTKAIKNN